MSRGEVWLVNLDSGKGHEQGGIRPAVIVGCVTAGIVVVVPITSNGERANFPYTEIINKHPDNGLTEQSVALVFQMRAIAQVRLMKPIGKLNAKDMERIDALIRDMLSL